MTALDWASAIGNQAVARLARDTSRALQPVPAARVPRSIQRAPVRTNGGTFTDRNYTPNDAPTGAVGEGLGAHIELEFEANDLVESTKIGLIQSVKAMKSSAAGGVRGTVATGVGDPEEGQLIMGAGEADPGREIDRAVHPGGRDLPNTSPIYGVHNTPGTTATGLGDLSPSTGTSQWGTHTKDPGTGAFLPPVPARIDDTPGRAIEFVGQTYEHTFESAAIAVEGPITPNTYLGSVSWGWRSDAAGKVTLDPLSIVGAGPPSAEFMGAAERWNAATFHDTSWGPLTGFLGLGAATPVGVPITRVTAGGVAVGDLSTSDLLRDRALCRLMIPLLRMGGAATAIDLAQKEFHQRAIEDELTRRNVDITLTCKTISDTGAAARPAEDEIWLSLTGGGSPTIALTSQRKFRAGDTSTFHFRVSDFLPLDGPIRVEINDHDRAGRGGKARDDVVLEFDWAAPFTPGTHADAAGHYSAAIAFDR